MDILGRKATLSKMLSSVFILGSILKGKTWFPMSKFFPFWVDPNSKMLGVQKRKQEVPKVISHCKSGWNSTKWIQSPLNMFEKLILKLYKLFSNFYFSPQDLRLNTKITHKQCHWFRRKDQLCINNGKNFKHFAINKNDLHVHLNCDYESVVHMDKETCKNFFADNNIFNYELVVTRH